MQAGAWELFVCLWSNLALAMQLLSLPLPSLLAEQ